jgi:hypothetical protein
MKSGVKRSHADALGSKAVHAGSAHSPNLLTAAPHKAAPKVAAAVVAVAVTADDYDPVASETRKRLRAERFKVTLLVLAMFPPISRSMYA